jgi:hypothetical protein
MRERELLSGRSVAFDVPMTDQYCSHPEYMTASITELLPALSGCGVSLEIRGMPWQPLLHNRREPAVPK